MNKARRIVRSLALLLALCLVLAWFPAQAMAEEEPVPTSGTCGENLTWMLDEDGVLTISGTGDMENYYDSTSARHPWENSAVKRVVIEPGVTSIGSYAFCGCINMTSIAIPDSVTSICDYAFSDCSGLTSITISDSMTSIGAFAFLGCSSLVSVTIPATLENLGNSRYPVFVNCASLMGIWVNPGNPNYCSDENGVLFSKDRTTLFTVPGGIHGSYTIPDTVDWIMQYAFSSCSGLTDIVIPDSVTFIGDYAFLGCSSLTSITIPQNAENVGGGVFNDCTNLENIIILSKSCELGNIAIGDPNVINKDIVICGYPGSSTEKYVNERNDFFASGIAFNKYNWEFVSLNDYEVIEGAKGEWTADSGETLTFRADGELDKFISVSVDDTTVDPSNYTVKSGSTIITFTEDYLKTLSVGEHTLTVTYTDGLAKTNFTVKAAPEGPSTDPETPTQPDEQPAEQPSEPAAEPEETSAGTDETTAPTEPATPSDNPKTGDNTAVLFLALLLVSGLGIMAIAVFRPKFH